MAVPKASADEVPFGATSTAPTARVGVPRAPNEAMPVGERSCGGMVSTDAAPKAAAEAIPDGETVTAPGVTATVPKASAVAMPVVVIV